MSSKKSEEFKKYLNKHSKSNVRAPVWAIAKAGKYLTRRLENWMQSSLGMDYKGGSTKKSKH